MTNKINRGNVINNRESVKNYVFTLASIIFIASECIEFWMLGIAA